MNAGKSKVMVFERREEEVIDFNTAYRVRLAESEGDSQRVVHEFYNVCKRRKLKVNTGKSKVMVFERREEEVTDFNTAYRVPPWCSGQHAWLRICGPGFDPGLGSRCIAHPAVHPSLTGWSINGYLGKPGEGKLW